MPLTYHSLKTRQRQVRGGFGESLALRSHRALSWLARAEQEAEDADARFIFLWIAFNAAYAREFEDREELNESKVLNQFLGALIGVDEERLLYDILWRQFPKNVRALLDNRFVFQPFWDYVNVRIPEQAWQQKFKASRAAANRALGKMNTQTVLAITFNRLYVLRNQLVHGGATWNGAMNRSQVTSGAEILGRMVPTIIHLMMENPDLPWTDPCYPVVD